MTRVRQRDLATFSKVLEGLYADRSAATLPARILRALETTVGCDFATYTLADLRQNQWHSFAMSAGVSDWPGLSVFQHFFPEDPAAQHILRTKTIATVKVSDFASLRQYRRLGIYKELFGRVGCDRRMGFAVQGRLPTDLTATVNRRGRDFSEEERSLIDLLQPHLLQANGQAYAQREALLARERERTGLGEAFGAGLGEIDAAARPRWLTPQARRLLGEFFPEGGSGIGSERLPEKLVNWLRAEPLSRAPGPGVEAAWRPRRRLWQVAGPEGRRLRVRLAPAEMPGRWYVMLEEASAQLPAQKFVCLLNLTLREAEVLYWVKEGKTNWAISAILGNSEKTVGKHLENILRKLDVENRAAAVRVAMETSLEG